MSYYITTLEAHSQAILENTERALQRLKEQLDPEDAALSSWAGDQMVAFHHAAIKALQLGLEHGSSEPYGTFPELRLRTNDTGTGWRRVDARLIHTKHGMCWILSESEALEFERKFIPFGARSRVQKELGMFESIAELPASRIVHTTCAFAGAPVHFSLVPAMNREGIK